jgi:1-acyl-sn-glycerol-3-phosphate acyltransferase
MIPISEPETQGLLYRVCRALAGVCLHTYLRGQAFGQEHIPSTGGAILLGNHQSYLDPILIGYEVPRACHYMARKPLFGIPLFRRLIAGLNAFPVDQDAADTAAIRESVRRLVAGRLLCLFGEGARSEEGRIEPLQRGVLVIARRSGVPIIPVVIDGAFESWPRHRRLPRPGRYAVEFGPAVPPSMLEGSPSEVIDRLTRTLRDLHNGLRCRVGHTPIDYNAPVP